MHTMLDEVGGRWASRASGGNVLDPTRVVPGPPFGSGGIEHIDELGATRSEDRFEVRSRDVRSRKTLGVYRDDQVRQAGADDLHGQISVHSCERQPEGSSIAVGELARHIHPEPCG
jgi:hypothetical protein